MRILSTALLSTTALSLAACGGSDDGSEPLIAGTVAGNYQGNAFTPDTGFAILFEGNSLIGVGDGNLGCASPRQDEPPPGTNAVMVVPALEVGTYANVLVNIYRNVDNFESRGSPLGNVIITAATADSIAGNVDYMDTDTDGLAYRLVGSFEVVRCPS